MASFYVWAIKTLLNETLFFILQRKISIFSPVNNFQILFLKLAAARVLSEC